MRDGPGCFSFFAVKLNAPIHRWLQCLTYKSSGIHSSLGYGYWITAGIWLLDYCRDMVTGLLQGYGYWITAGIWLLDYCRDMVTGLLQPSVCVGIDWELS